MNSDMEKTAIPILDKIYFFFNKVPCNQNHSCDIEFQNLSSISGSLSDIFYRGKVPYISGTKGKIAVTWNYWISK